MLSLKIDLSGNEQVTLSGDSRDHLGIALRGFIGDRRPKTLTLNSTGDHSLDIFLAVCAVIPVRD
jgi:hypothetical protein